MQAKKTLLQFFTRRKTCYHAARLAALARDNWRCQWPGCGQRRTRTRAVNTHHIIQRCHNGPDTADNLVTLCHQHHTQLHRLLSRVQAERQAARRQARGVWR